MKQISIIAAASKVAFIGAAALLVACGDSVNVSPELTDTTVSGAIVAAPVNGADVSIIDGNGNVVVGPVKTDAAGQYSLKLPLLSLTQDLIVKSTGGIFKDEATGSNGIAGEMYAYASANSIVTGSSVSATPGSTIIASLVMNHTRTMAQAEAAFKAAFGYTPDLSITPVDATDPAAASADEAARLAGLHAAAFSQLAMDLGLSQDDQFELFAALAKDLSDDKLDGVDASGAVAIGTTGKTLTVDIQNRFVIALLNFHNDGLMGDTKNDNDMTGLDNSQIGVLPFAKVATTGSTAGAYKVEYFPGMMDAMQGKTEFQLKISDDSGAPVSSTVELMLMMSMEDRKHSTPDLDCEEDIAIIGEYYCTVYYVMPSVMATGDSMGYWQMKVMVDMKSAVLYPQVMMAMGDTTRALLKGIASNPVLPTDDTISMMGVTSSRPYNLFRNDLSGTTGSHIFHLFIAPMEDMMNFPALEVGDTLNGTFNVNDVKVEFSTDASSWAEATSVGSPGTGSWGITGLTGLTDGVAGKIYVKLSVDAGFGYELKTTNGLVADGMNDYAFFNVTP